MPDVNYTRPADVPTHIGWDPLYFVCSVGRYAYCVSEFVEPDNRKADPHIYDMEAREFRNDLLPQDNIPLMSNYLYQLLETV